MASIVKRGSRYYVVSNYINQEGQRKQKWESFKDLNAASRRKAELELATGSFKFEMPQCNTVEELMREYVELYGKSTWSLSVYRSNTRLIKHYINPIIGTMKLSDITPRLVEKYYQRLLMTKAVPKNTEKKGSEVVTYVTPHTVKKVHNILRSAFNQAMKWEIMEKNPAMLAKVPKYEPKRRDIWDAETLFHALELCTDDRLSLAMNLSFACSLRMGEILGLTWDCVHISDEEIEAGEAYLYVEKELQRVERDAVEALNGKDIIVRFPPQLRSKTSMLVLKSPKTPTSVRKVFIPKSVAQMLQKWHEQQDLEKGLLGSEYRDYNLVMAGPLGHPIENSTINAALRNLIRENNLPPVVFHSLRHSSITYKLKLNGGNIKAVQGDSGHAQAKMVTDQYSHILDEDRKNNAELFERVFYNKGTAEDVREVIGSGGQSGASGRGMAGQASGPAPKQASELDENAALLMKLMTNPETAALLKALASTMK